MDRETVFRMARSRLVSTSVAAREIGIDSTTLWRWHKSGEVSATEVTKGGHLRWDMDELRRQLKRRSDRDRYAGPVNNSDRPEHRPVVAALVVSHLGVLVGKRNDNVPPWSFISGKVEPGESIRDAGTREVKEETGLAVTAAQREVGRRVHPVTGRTLIYLACHPTEGTDVFIGDPHELSDVRWVSLAQLDDLMGRANIFDPVWDYLACTIN